MEKVVDSELKNQIVITSEDISRYYDKNLKRQDPANETSTKTGDINETIIKHLRREKAEQAYKVWIEKLKVQYTIETNSIQWEKITGTKYSEGENLGALDSTAQ